MRSLVYVFETFLDVFHNYLLNTIPKHWLSHGASCVFCARSAPLRSFHGSSSAAKSFIALQVRSEDHDGLFPRLRAGGLASAGGAGAGPRRGGPLRHAAAAGRRAPAHQAGVQLRRQSAPLLLCYKRLKHQIWPLILKAQRDTFQLSRWRLLSLHTVQSSSW